MLSGTVYCYKIVEIARMLNPYSTKSSLNLEEAKEAQAVIAKIQSQNPGTPFTEQLESKVKEALKSQSKAPEAKVEQKTEPKKPELIVPVAPPAPSFPEQKRPTTPTTSAKPGVQPSQPSMPAVPMAPEAPEAPALQIPEAPAAPAAPEAPQAPKPYTPASKPAAQKPSKPVAKPSIQEDPEFQKILKRRKKLSEQGAISGTGAGIKPTAAPVFQGPTEDQKKSAGALAEGLARIRAQVADEEDED